MKINLIGASYESQAIKADAQKTVNWMPEVVESGTGRAQVVLNPTPGLKSFAVIDAQMGVDVDSIEVEHGWGVSADIKSVRVSRSSPTKSPSSSSQTSVPFKQAWVNPDKAFSLTDFATVPLSTTLQYSQTLTLSGCGLTLPSDQSCSAVTVEFAFDSSAMSDMHVYFQAFKGAVSLGTVAILPTYFSGGTTSITVPATMSAADANDPMFAIQIRVTYTGASSTVFSLGAVKVTPTVAPYLTIETESAHGYGNGNNIALTRIPAASWLNDQIVTIDSAPSPTTFTALFNHADYYALDSGKCWNGGLVAPYLIIKTKTPHGFAVGTTGTLSGLANATWSNGHSVTVKSVLPGDPKVFTAEFSHEDYGPVLEPSGRLLLGSVSGFNPVRNAHEINGRVFAVSGPNLFEIFADGSYTLRGGVTNDGSPISFAANAHELILCCGGNLYRLLLSDNTFAAISDTDGPITDISKVEYTDGYFLALIKNSRQWRISGIEDGSTWNPIDLAVISVFPDNATSMLVDHRQVWIWGNKKAVVYENSGNPDFPFDVASFIDQGCAALFSPVRLDNSVIWLGQDERGAGMVWRAQGYTPARISNHALEHAMQSYARIDDAVAYGFQMDGHSIYHLYFPTANKSWRYDVATNTWCEVAFWRVNDGEYEAHHSQCHVYAFGKHLVGDWSSGNVYEMSNKYGTDNGEIIRGLRRSPHVNSGENDWTYLSELQIEVEVEETEDSGPVTNPVLMVRTSKDGGHSWMENMITLVLGSVGQYMYRAIRRRLGRSRNWTWEVICTEKARVRVIDGWVR